MNSKNLIYAPRLKTDTLFHLLDGNFRYEGVVDRTIRLVEKNYLCNADTWKSFVDVYRQTADKDGGWSCEFWGKMMRGASLTYQYTRNDELYSVLTGAVKDMLSTEQPTGEFSACAEEMKFGGWDMWGRKYILLGFEYYLEICKDGELEAAIIKAICRHADRIMERVGAEEGKIGITDACAAWSGLPASSILEPYMRLYNLTGEKRYFDFAKYIVECGGIKDGNIWDDAYSDEKHPYQYKIRKAYEMMSCFEGLIEYYRVTGIEKYKESAVRYAKKIIESDVTIIGCAGCEHELFDNAARTQLDTEYDGVMQETCVTVTWMKFCHQLLLLTGDPAFADQIELSSYNAMLGSVNDYGITDAIEGMPFDSYSPLLYGTRARLSGGFRKLENLNYGCCGCIGSAGTALMALSSAMSSADGIYVNLYYPGEICADSPSGNRFVLKIDTKYPAENKIRITFVSETEENMKIAVRIPAYSKNNTFSINGGDVQSVNSGYHAVERLWKNGDVIELDIDTRVRTFRTEGVDENSKYHVALYKGPVVLARDARLGEQIDAPVDIAEDENGFVAAEISNTADFPTNIELKIPMKDGSYITAIDYASAGKTYKRDSAMTAWMATKAYWEPDFSKTLVLASRGSEIRRYFFIGEDNLVHGSIGTVALTPWKAVDAGDGYVRLLAPCGKYITVADTVPYSYASMEEYTEDDCQKWKFVHFLRNYYILVHKKTGCALYEQVPNGMYRLFSTEKGCDGRYPSDISNFNIDVNVLIRVTNAPWDI